MMVTSAPAPITIHIPPDLQHLRVTLKQFLDDQPLLNCLSVGAFVFTPRPASPSAHVAPVPPQRNTYRADYDFDRTSEHEFTLRRDQFVEVIQQDAKGWSLVRAFDGSQRGWTPSAYLVQEQLVAPSPPTTPETRLLLVQRSSQDSLPNRWEVPGGSSDLEDPTILHSVARELFEETGLHLTRFNRQIGTGVRFETGRQPQKKQWLKLSFEVEVSEIPSISNSHVHHQDSTAGLGNDDLVAGQLLNSVIKLDPEEHQKYAWATEEDIRNSDPNRPPWNRGPFEIFNEEQRLLMLRAFELRKNGQ